MHIPDPIKQLIYINGIFDIICGVGILSDIPILRDIHLSFLKKYDDRHRRFMAFWILNYGIIRLLSTNMTLVQLSYVLEGVAYLIEMQSDNQNSCAWRGTYTVSACLLIAGLIH